MTNSDKKLLHEIYTKCEGNITLSPKAITLDDGRTITVYRKDSTCKYPCSITKSPDATKYKDYYTISVDSNQELITICSPELKQKWFKDKDTKDFIGGKSGKSYGEYDISATFANLGISPVSIDSIIYYKDEVEPVNLWNI